MKEKEEKRKMAGGFQVTLSLGLTIYSTTKTSSRIRLFRRFRIRLNWPESFVGVELADPLKFALELRPVYLWGQNLASHNDY